MLVRRWFQSAGRCWGRAPCPAAAAGVLLYELVALERPFKGPTAGALYAEVTQGKYAPVPAAAPAAIARLIKTLLSTEEWRRPSASWLLEQVCVRARALFLSVRLRVFFVHPPIRVHLVQIHVRVQAGVACQRTAVRDLPPACHLVLYFPRDDRLSKQMAEIRISVACAAPPPPWLLSPSADPLFDPGRICEELFGAMGASQGDN